MKGGVPNAELALKNLLNHTPVEVWGLSDFEMEGCEKKSGWLHRNRGSFLRCKDMLMLICLRIKNILVHSDSFCSFIVYLFENLWVLIT